MLSAIDLNLFLCMVLKFLSVTVLLVTALVLYILGVSMHTHQLLLYHMMANVLLMLLVLAIISVTITLTILQVRVPRVTSAVRKTRVRTS